MLKKIVIAVVLVAVFGLLVLGAVNRTLAKGGNEGPGQGGYGRGRTGAGSTLEQPVGSVAGDPQSLGNGYGRGLGAENNTYAEHYYLDPSAVPGELSESEAAALLFMREEEKLAHDVYVTLYSQWGLPVFQNISRSEQTHTDAVKALLDRYGLADPASSQVGVFTNPDLQALYNDLVTRGSQSLAEALKVGAAIEEIDIQDLETRLSETNNADIQQVFSNLQQASNNHLRAFVSTLNVQTGETYQPQVLSSADYQAIIAAPGETGGTGTGRGGGNSGGGGWRGGRP